MSPKSPLDCDFFLTLVAVPGLRSPGQVFCRRSSCLSFSDAFFMVRLELWVLGRTIGVNVLLMSYLRHAVRMT